MLRVSPGVRRWFARALILVLVPLVWLAGSPELAAAAPSETLSFTLADSQAPDVHCQIGLAMSGTAVIVGAGGWCQISGVPAPGCDALEIGCTDIAVEVMNGFGTACGSSPLEIVASSGLYTTTATLGAASIQVGDCDPVQICMSMVYDAAFFHTDVSACVDTSLDPAVDAEDEICDATGTGIVGTPIVTESSVLDVGNGNYRAHITVQGSVPPMPTGDAYWIFYTFAKIGPTQGNDSRLGQSSAVVPYRNLVIRRQPGQPHAFVYVTESNLLSEQAANDWLIANEFVGLGLYRFPDGANLAETDTIPRTLPDIANQVHGRLGVSDPNRCAYYWGIKMANKADPLDTTDEPLGPVVDDTDGGGGVVEPPPVEPPDEDDGGNWWDFLPGLFKKLTDAVKAIATAIINGLKALFIPSDDQFLKKAVNRMSDDFDGKFPFTLGDNVESMGSGDSAWGSASCPDWKIKVGPEDWSAVCDSSFTAAIRGSRGFILAGMLMLAFWPLTRGVFWASFPLIKPTPSGSEKS